MFHTSMANTNLVNYEMQNLITDLKDNFPIHIKSHFDLFAFSNEKYFSQALDEFITSMPRKLNQVNIGLIFGESHILSMLPELAKQVNLVVFADIEPNLHKHIQHLLGCLIKSATISEFKSNYIINNPVVGINEWDLRKLMLGLEGDGVLDSLKNYHFLSSAERYNQCKTSLKELSFVNISLDLFNQLACERFSQILKKHAANLAFCNFSNIHHYDVEYKIKSATTSLVQFSSQCYFMYAIGTSRSAELCTNFSANVQDYFDLKKTYIAAPLQLDLDTEDTEGEDSLLSPEFLVLQNAEVSQQPLKPFVSTILRERYGLTFLSSLGNATSSKDEDIGDNDQNLLPTSNKF